MSQQLLNQMNSSIQTIWKESGFNSLTPIQSEAIPKIMEGQDIIAQAPTGSGKTLAYLLPLIQKIDIDNNSLQAVILAPSRELVMQIHEETQKWTKGSEVKTASLVGGANIKRQIERLKSRPQLVVGTPGRLLELIQLKKLKMHDVRVIVLDEGDQLLGPELLNTVRTVVKSALNDRQLLLFSATEVKEPGQVEALIGRKPEQISIQKAVTKGNGKVEHYYLQCDPRERAKLLQKIAAMKGMKALVFVRDMGNLNVLSEKLQFEKVKIATLHSEMNKQDRERAIQSLKNGTVTLLLATDIAARGLDIEGLTHVIHYDLPKDPDQYIHRSGRTGRMGANGTVVSLVSTRNERDLERLTKKLNIKVQARRIYKGQFVNSNPNSGTNRK